MNGEDSDGAINSDVDFVKETRFSNLEKSNMVIKTVYKHNMYDLEDMMKDAEKWKVVSNIIYKGNSKTYNFVPEERNPTSQRKLKLALLLVRFEKRTLLSWR